MGVKDLWNILSPLCDRKPLFELQGKTLAIDMSGWVVDSQSVADHSVQPKMYLRNLYFRTVFLLMQGIAPVFVLEGKAPSLKHNTIAKRNDVRSGFCERKQKPKGNRSQFNRVLKECREMLECMGLACVQGYGEAEAMCAYLNEDGLVDGCISQDSDCFLYGAKVVYRNFCMSAQGNRGGTGGAVDEYNLEKIERILELSRNKMIALALLCGCDYDGGLNGVGKEAAMKLFKIVKDEDILQRLKSWKTDDALERKERELLNPNLCSSCGHSGKVQKHTKSGCVDCGTVVKCNSTYKETRALILNEIALRKKALLIEDFPNQELIDEFLIRKDPVPTKIDIQWKQPKINKFIEFMDRHLSWEPLYAFEKIFPLVTRWQLLHLPNISVETRLTIPNLFIPEAIKKVRNIRSVASYEIVWKKDHDIIERLKEYIALDDENDGNDAGILSELITIEPQGTVQKCYPEIVEMFENAKIAKKVKAKKRPAKNKIPSKVDGKCQTEKKHQKKREKLPSNIEKNRIIDEFLRNDHPMSLDESFELLTITPKRSKKSVNQQENTTVNSKLKRGPQVNKVLQLENINTKLNNTLDRMFNELSPDDFTSDNDDHDLNMSDIINDICSENIFRFNTIQNVRILKDGNDICENNIEPLKSVDDIIDAQTQLNQCQQTNAVCDDSLDEFGDISESYVPINERVYAHKEQMEVKKFVPGKNNRFSLGFDKLMNDTVSESTNTNLVHS